jgi:hypothetical protein
MGANSLICEVRWERYPLVAENVHSRAWLTWQCNRGLAANTLEAYGRGLEKHLLFLARRGLMIEQTTRLEVSAPAISKTAWIANDEQRQAVLEAARREPMRNRVMLAMSYGIPFRNPIAREVAAIHHCRGTHTCPGNWR